MFLNVWLMVSEAGRVGTNTGWTCSNDWICQIKKRFILWWKHKEQFSRPPGEQKSKKTPPANPRRSLFKNCFKSYFDTARWWEMSCVWFLAELLIYKTILLFWWRISIALEFRSQCHIFRFGNIAYCYEIDIFLTKTLLIVTRSAYSLTKTLPIVARLAYAWPMLRTASAFGDVWYDPSTRPQVTQNNIGRLTTK